MSKLTKEKMILRMCANEKNLTKAAAGRILDNILNEVMETVAAGDHVTFTNFGSFCAVETKEHTGHNPQTGETITVPAGRRIRFTPGKRFKDRL